jgi:hypothetical protein
MATLIICAALDGNVRRSAIFRGVSNQICEGTLECERPPTQNGVARLVQRYPVSLIHEIIADAFEHGCKVERANLAGTEIALQEVQRRIDHR